MRCTRRWWYALILAAAALVLMLVSASVAQVTTRFAEGTVTDESDRPIDGAVVQLKNTVTLQVRSYVTSTDGKYHFSGLSRDFDYELVAQYDGRRSSTRTLSRFDSRTAAVVDLEIRMSG